MTWRATLTPTGKFSLVDEASATVLMTGRARPEIASALMTVISEAPSMIEALVLCGAVLRLLIDAAPGGADSEGVRELVVLHRVVLETLTKAGRGDAAHGNA